MPCYDPPEDRRVEYRDDPQTPGLQAQVAYLTRMLCAVCSRVVVCPGGDNLLKLAGAWAWWEAHEAEDKRRVLAESETAAIAETKKAALAKLTPEERTALGYGRDL